MNLGALGRQVWLAIPVLVALELVAISGLRVRIMLAVYVGITAVLIWIRRRELLGKGPWRVPFLIGFALSVLLPISLIFFGGDDPLGRVIDQLLPTLTGWCIFLAVLVNGTGDAAAGGDVDRGPSVKQAVIGLAAVFALLAVVHNLAVGNLALVADEVVYLVQSRFIAPGRWTVSVPPDVAPFFLMRQIGYLDGHLVGQYPPGWPMLLAGFRMLGLEWWSSVILGTVSVALTYQLGARLHSKRMGMIAAALLATSQVFVVGHAGYMSHAPAIVALLAATICLLKGLDQVAWRRWAWWAAAGALLGAVVTIRPLTGLSLGASVGIWMLLKAWQVDRRAPFVMAACVAVGGIIPATFFIGYNLSVLGEPLTTGYGVIHDNLYRLGFGTHGYMVLDADVQRVPVTFQFTPTMALDALLNRLASINVSYVAIGLLAPITVAAVAAGFRISWVPVGIFALIAVAHFFYRYPSIRLFTELLPFLLLSVASMLLAIRARWPKLASGLLAMLFMAQVVLAIPVPSGRPSGNRPLLDSDYGPGAPARLMALQTADSLARVHGNVLLFSREGTRFDNLIDRLYVFNTPTFDGRIVVARDRGQRNSELMRRYPDHVPFLVEDRHGQTPALFTRLDGH
jgi:Dolichyl-phosphate-mannose-protein mannosyltransferase